MCSASKRWTPLLVATILSMTAPAFSQDKVVHFSSINGQTGQSAAYGSKVIEGVNLAAKAINDAGGFADKCGARYKVKITTGDMANSREQAVSLLRQAAADASVVAVVGVRPHGAGGGPAQDPHHRHGLGGADQGVEPLGLPAQHGLQGGRPAPDADAQGEVRRQARRPGL